MQARINIICYKSKILKDGKSPLMVRVFKDSKIKYKSLGICVHPDHWDFQKNRPKNDCPNRELILKIILEKEASFQKQILELKSEDKEYTASTLIDAKLHEIFGIPSGCHKNQDHSDFIGLSYGARSTNCYLCFFK